MKKLLYIQLAEKIMIEALNSNMEPGAKMPSVREMALKHSANAKTVQKAFDYLDDKGIFTSVVGGGRYLSTDENILHSIKQELVEVEIAAFINKMKEFECDKQFIMKKIEEDYE